jgi:hypothetical protein
VRTLDPEADVIAAMRELTAPPERRWSGTFDPVNGPASGTLDEQLREELTRTDGTPQWRAWVENAAKRRDIHPT